MTIASGVNKLLAYKKETAWGTAAGTASAQSLRRVSSDLGLKKQTYESNELLSHRQRVDYRHGVKSIEGSISGELSPGTYKEFFAAAVAKDFASVSSITGLSITVAASGSNYTVARGSGSWLTDGIKAGDTVRLTAGSLNAANLNKNLFVLSVVALTLTVTPVNGVAMVAEGPIASCTLAVPGKKTYAPTSSHTDDSFTVEHYMSDLTLSELFTGCKVDELSVNLPPTGMATIGIKMMGKDLTTAGSRYFVSPTTETTTGLLAAVNGVLSAQGATLALITSLSFAIKRNMTAEPVVGSNTYADITEGRILVEGQFTALFSGATERDYFINETEVALAAVFAASSSAAADFLGFSFPRIKVGSADMDDGDKSLSRTFSFTALYNSTGGAGTSSEQSTVVVQDSQA